MQTFTLQDIADIQRQGRFEEAEKLYNAALSQDPNDWIANFYLSTLMHQMGKHGLAISLLHRAESILSKPKYKKDFDKQIHTIYCNLGVSYRTENHYKQAAKYLKLALKHKKTDADLYVNLGSIYVNEGDPAEGEKVLKKGLEVDPDNVLAHWNLSLCLLEQQKFEEGWKEYHYGKFKHKANDFPERLPRWMNYPEFKGDKETVLTYGEQGIGDEILFMSMLPDLVNDAEKVIYECHPRLENIVKRSFPNVTVYPTRKEKTCFIEDDFDSVRALGDLGALYRNDMESFPKLPYLVADPEKTQMFREELEALGPGPYYGIGWRGGYKKTRKDLRSLTLDELKPILEQKGTFVSLQYDVGADSEVKKFCDENGIKIHHWPDVVRADDYDITASLVSALDLVIACNTSVVHLCGSLGVPCWTMTPKKCAWRYGKDSLMPWYGTVECIRAKGEDWEPVISEVVQRMQKIEKGMAA